MDMNFGNEGGPFMSGHWYNPKTGDSFTVRDTFMEDNNIIVLTTDGRRMDYNMIQQYVKTEKPMPKKPVDGYENKNSAVDIPEEVRAIMADAEEDLKSLTTKTATEKEYPLSNPVTPQQNIYSGTVSSYQEIDEDQMLIKRLLKRAAEPTISCAIRWNNFPKEQIHMLDMMAVDDEKIIEYYISKMNLEDIKKSISESLRKYLNDMMSHDKYEYTVVPIKNKDTKSEDSSEPISTVQVAENETVTTKKAVEKPKKNAPKRVSKTTKK